MGEKSFSACGSPVLSSSGRTLQEWDTITGQKIGKAQEICTGDDWIVRGGYFLVGGTGCNGMFVQCVFCSFSPQTGNAKDKIEVGGVGVYVFAPR